MTSIPEQRVSPSEEFLSAFSQIETVLRSRLRAKNGTGFRQLVENCSRTLPEVRHYEEDLLEFAELRNAIVHDRRGGRIIAEPIPEVVAEIQAIARVIAAPPTVVPAFLADVRVASVTDDLAAVASIMTRLSFSQVPVLDSESFVGLLTANTIARWLGRASVSDCLEPGAVPIVEVLGAAEDTENHLFVDPGTSLFEAFEAFGAHEQRGRRLDAVLITDSGGKDHRIRGIITVSDLPRLVSLLPRHFERRS